MPSVLGLSERNNNCNCVLIVPLMEFSFAHYDGSVRTRTGFLLNI